MRPTYALINRSNLKFNYLTIRKKVKNAKVMAVVKADAYGHGVSECVKALNELGDKKPEYYAVALIEEAIELRKAGIKQPVLVFSTIYKDHVENYFKYNLLPTVFSPHHIQELKKASGGKKLKVHVKIDTGMGRLGVDFNEAFSFIKALSNDRDIKIDGIYTHFATSDEQDKAFANLQLSRFKQIIDQLKSEGINYGLAHAANSGAIVDMPEAYLDMVRPGIALYGYYPSLETSESIKLKPIMSLITHVASIKNINPGDSVSYGRRFIAEEPTRIATLPIGYADGYVRGLSNKIGAIIGSRVYRQVGQVCMDRIMLNIGNNRVKEGDEVILLGKKKNMQIDAWDWSRILGTIPYEITCNISDRVPRIYTD